MIPIMFADIQSLFANGRASTVGTNETLFNLGLRVRSMYLVTEGLVELVRHSKNGTRMVLFRAGPAQVLAEASAYSETYHCDGVSVKNARLLSVPVATFRSRLERDPGLANAWSANLAHSLQLARIHAEIRGLRTVSERLDAWLSDKPLPPKGEWQNMAQELGVSREALYRELSKRR